MKSVFDDLIDQDFAVATLRKALKGKTNLPHAWIFSGPQGCGLDSAILAFSAALICVNNGCGECSDCQNVILGVHPDIEILSTSGLSIKIDEIRELIEKSNWAPSISKRRVLVIKEAERLTEAASNALLRAIEEPNDNVIWLLSSYTADSLSGTIKSRCNMVRLKSPSSASITNVLLKEFKLSSEEAENISRICLNDLDRAKDLAKNKELLVFRKQVLSRLLKLKSLSDAFQIAQFIVEECKQISEQNLEETNDQEISNLKLSWGSTGSKMVAGGTRLIKELEKTQKNRVTRKSRDILEDILMDIYSIYRDCIIFQQNLKLEKVNVEFINELQELSKNIEFSKIYSIQSKILKSKFKIGANASPLLVLESLFAHCA